MNEQDLIERVSANIEAMCLPYATDAEAWEHAVRINENEGWTFEGPKSRDGSIPGERGYLRYEGMHLSPDQLSRAFQQAVGRMVEDGKTNLIRVH